MNVDIDDSENKTRFPDDSFRANVNQKVTNYSPVLNIKHRFNKSNTLTLDYMGTMTSPTGTQLQDYTDISDPTNSIKGNPDLKPQFANDVVLNLSGSNSKTQDSTMSVCSVDTQRMLFNLLTILIRRQEIEPLLTKM